jgi:hypothetical protein
MATLQHLLTSGTFWAAAGAVIGLLVGTVAIRATYRVAFPRRRILYGMPVVAPMRSDAIHQGTALSEPHFLNIRLVSRSRLDTPSSAYDKGNPIRLDVAIPIVEVLKVTSFPESIPAPEFTIDGSALKVGPSRIGKRQEILFSVLADGDAPKLTCESSLIDVQVRRLTSEDLRPVTTAKPFIYATLAAGSAIGALWAFAAASTARVAASAARVNYHSILAQKGELDQLKDFMAFFSLDIKYFQKLQMQAHADLGTATRDGHVASIFTLIAIAFAALTIAFFLETAFLLWRRRKRHSRYKAAKVGSVVGREADRSV